MSKHYLILEDGETVEVLEQKNKEIKERLANTITRFKNEEKCDRKGAKRFGFRLLMQIEDELSKSERMSADDFVNLTAEDLDELWRKFHSLMAYFNIFFEIVPNRQTFMLYCRINSRQYKQLMESPDEDIRSIIAFIEDRFVGKGFSASENGNTNSTAVMNRLKSAEVGHSVVSASEKELIDAVSPKTPLELEREIKQLLGNS